MANENFTITISGGVSAALFSNLERFVGKIGSINGLLGGLGTKLAGAFGAYQLANWINSAAKAADETKKLSEELDIAADRLSKRQFAAELAGAGESFRQGMTKFASNFAEAAADSESSAAKLFGAMGVPINDLVGKSNGLDEAMLRVADRFAGWSNGANKAKLAMEAFGTRQTRFINFLNGGRAGLEAQGKELEQLGGVLDDDKAAKLEAFNDAMTKLQTVSQGLAVDLGSRLLPVFTQLIESMKGINEGGTQFGSVFDGVVVVVKSLASVLMVVVTAFQQLGTIIGQIPVAAFEAAKFNFSNAKAVLNQLGNDLDQLSQNNEKRLAALWGKSGQPAGPKNADNAKAGLPNAPAILDKEKQARKELQQIDAKRTEGQQEYQLALLETQRLVQSGQLTHAQALERDKKAAGDLAENLAEVNRQLSDLADQNPNMPELREKANSAFLDMDQARLKSGQPSESSFGAQLRGSMTDLQNQFGTTAQIVARGFTQTIGAAVQSVSQGISGLLKGTMDWGQALQTISGGIMNGVIDAIGRMFAEWIAARAMAAAKNIFFSTQEGTADAAAKAPGALMTSISSFGIAAAVGVAALLAAMAAFGGFAAGGQTPGNPTLAWVGEKGSEFVIPHNRLSEWGTGFFEGIRQGDIKPADVARGSAGGKGQNVNVGFLNTRQDEREFAAKEGWKITVDQMRKRGNKVRV